MDDDEQGFRVSLSSQLENQDICPVPINTVSMAGAMIRCHYCQHQGGGEYLADWGKMLPPIAYPIASYTGKEYTSLTHALYRGDSEWKHIEKRKDRANCLNMLNIKI